jgi:hypothetical protein
VSLLTACQNVVKETGIGTAPSTIISNADLTAIQLNALAERSAKKLAKMNWQRMVREQTITTSSSLDLYSLPSDWGRYISDTAWDTTNYWPMRGSIDPAMWQALKRGIVATSIRKRFRLRGNMVMVYPTPTSADVLIFEYLRNTPWVASDGTTYKAAATADADTTVFPEYLLELEIKWRFKHAKGLDYSEDFAEAEREIAKAFAQDTPAYALNFGTTAAPAFAANLPPNIPT